MMESEAINVLNMIEAHGDLAIKAKQTAINALEEVHQYRAIGTLEELKEAMKYVWLVKKHGTIGKALEECAEYESIGTPEECRAAMERQNPIAAIAEKEDTGTTKYTCSACGMYMGWSTGTFPARYCWKCGQKLDWGDEE